MDKKFGFSKLFQYFLQGVLVLAPIAISFYALYYVITTIDSLIPIFHYIDENGVKRTQIMGWGL